MYGSSGPYRSPSDKLARVTAHLGQIVTYAQNELIWICYDLIRPACEIFDDEGSVSGEPRAFFDEVKLATVVRSSILYNHFEGLTSHARARA